MAETDPDTIAEHSLLAERYRVGAEIARGGEGTVYSVVDEQTGDVRALKRLLPPATPKTRAQFEREYRTLAGIRHPRIIEVFDYGLDDGIPYYTMELLDGQDLRELAPLPAADAFLYMRDVATSLALLHTRRLLHRDIKASNIRVTGDGHCKLLDFGGLTPFGMPERVVGTPPYLPPEALRRAPLDQRADLYAFGALCYWILTRKSAYPARKFTELPELWHRRAAPPSRYNPEIPKAADRLILSLIDPDPMARPKSAAEVVELLNSIGELPPEDEQTERALGESYLATTHFVGRGPEMETLAECVTGLQQGQGAAHVLEGPSGVGTTRLLEELHARARMADLPTVHVDAAMHDRQRGTILAAIAQLIEASEAARKQASRHAALLGQLDPNLASLLGPAEVASAEPTAQAREVILGVVRAASEQAPLLIIVDNADQADAASLGILEGIARRVDDVPLALVMAGRVSTEPSPQWATLRGLALATTVAPFTQEETLELSRTVFGDAQNLVGLAQWLHRRGGGLPLHSVESLRQLHADDVIRFRDGVWFLPIEAPQVDIPPQLEGLIDRQLDALSPAAYALAESVAIRRGALAHGDGLDTAEQAGEAEYQLFEELLRRNVLSETVDGYSFRNNAMRDAIDRRMAPERRRELHLQSAQQVIAHGGEPLSHNAGIEAGWHLLHAGEDARGADMLATVAYDNIGVRLSFADLQVVAPALEAALEVFERQERTLLERAPLLAALAQAGYYEHRRWAHKYGEIAIDACEEVTGLKTARRLRPWLGRTGSLAAGLGLAWLRYLRAPREARRCSFGDLIVQLMGLVTCLTGVAACALDSEGARRTAGVLEPFMHLPERLTPVGLGHFCLGLSELGRDNPAAAVEVFDRLSTRFHDPRYYPTLPAAARPLYHGGIGFARGVFQAFRDEGGALEAADTLDALGMKMYRLVATELRMLHYINRGSLVQASEQARLVEIHAVEMGSASLVELWEPAALLLAHGSTGELVSLRNAAQRLAENARTYPIMARYARLAELAIEHTTRDRMRVIGEDTPIGEAEQAITQRALDLLEEAEPRGFIGWGFLVGQTARTLNQQGRYADAKQTCRRVVDIISEEDRKYVALFLTCELEHAVADAGLGEFTSAAQQLDALLEAHAGSDNPLTRGRIHEAYCQVAAMAERWTLYRHHLAATRSFYRATDSTALAGRVETLASLEHSQSLAPGPTGSTRRMRADGSPEDGGGSSS